MPKHVMKVMDHTGHSTKEWSPTDEKSVEAVKAEFDALIAQGFQAYSIIDRTGGEMLRTFDPEAREIVMAIPLQGG